LLDAGMKIDYRNSMGETALMVSSGAGREDVAIELLNRGANPNVPDLRGKSILLNAIESCGKVGHCESHRVVDLILEKGADPNPRPPNYSAATPICAAISYDSTEIVKELFAKGARLQRDGCLPAPFVMTKQRVMVQVLLDGGLKPVAADVYMHLQATEAEREAAAVIEAELPEKERSALAAHRR
jgi:ankyrin repeat protein